MIKCKAEDFLFKIWLWSIDQSNLEEGPVLSGQLVQTPELVQLKITLNEILSVFSSDPPRKDGNVRFTRAPLKLCVIKYGLVESGIDILAWRVT